MQKRNASAEKLLPGLCQARFSLSGPVFHCPDWSREALAAMESSALIASLKAGNSLDASAVAAAAALLLDTEADPSAKADLLRALSAKGETAEEIAGFVSAFLQHAVRPPLDLAALGKPVMDVCGTGGDKLDLFNISTAGMFILAAGGVAVVKHGNRGVTSKSGSADVLEALGVAVNLAPERYAECVQRHGTAFMLAPQYHPAFKAVAPVRMALAKEGVRTIFNLIGPLLNPLQPPFQIIGVFDAALPPVYAEILRRLGRTRAWAVHGSAGDGRGMDEISTLGPTRIAALENGMLSDRTESVPLPVPIIEDLKGGDAATNAAIIEGILSGELKGAKRDIVLANAAAAFQVAGLENGWDAALARAAECVDSGRARSVLENLRAFPAG
jgi:anthranilate phosphoribosyltransferase